jgi:hypothetical protein
METILLQSVVIMPQIYSNLKYAKKSRLLTAYYLGYLSSRCLLPLYVRAYPENIFKIEPSFSFCTLWISSYMVQLVILYMQARLGGRFFVPKCCLFIYQDDAYRLMEHNSASSLQQECSICLEDMYQSRCINESSIVRAPCNHHFHLECLKSWIDVKQQCPICRSRLP